jgi:ABC-type multidrug transport system ATPase subunit
MKIEVNKISKRYQRPILSEYSDSFEREIVGIQGENGSGKSTLLKCLLHLLQVDSGEINYFKQNEKIQSKEIFNQIAYASPLLKLPEFMSVRSLLGFHFELKPLKEQVTIQDIIENDFSLVQDTLVGDLSSGWLQKLKLALCLYSQSDIIGLDEPTETLDEFHKNWFYSKIKEFSKDRLIFIASNEPRDLELTHRLISL